MLVGVPCNTRVGKCVESKPSGTYWLIYTGYLYDILAMAEVGPQPPGPPHTFLPWFPFYKGTVVLSFIAGTYWINEESSLEIHSLKIK